MISYCAVAAKIQTMKHSEGLDPMYFNLDMIFDRHDEYYIVGISFGKNIVSFWEPVARELGLELLSSMDSLNITEAKRAQQLVEELKRFEASIESNSHSVELTDGMQEHFLKCIQRLMPHADYAANHWDEMYAIVTSQSGP